MTYIALADMDEWEEFAKRNHEDIERLYGSTAKAYQHAIQGGLVLFDKFISFQDD